MNQNPNASSNRTLVVGEALIDIVERPGDSAEFIGGSPANIAVGLARLGHPAQLLTRLGSDTRGERIAGYLADEGVHLLPESWGGGPTSTAHARISADGSADYHFDIDWRLPERTVDTTPLVHAGSIALFLEPGGAQVLSLLERLSGSAMITLDPNIRASLLDHHGQAVQRFERAAALADLVKLSDEDAEWLYPDSSPESVADRVRELGPSIVAVTLGARGALAVTASGRAQLHAHPVEVVDTISAGDSFMASLISSLLERGVDGAAAALPDVLDRAARAAAIAVSAAGANPPRREQLDAFQPMGTIIV